MSVDPRIGRSIRGLEAFFHRNRARVVRGLIAKYATPDAPILDAGCGTGLNLRYLPKGSVGVDINCAVIGFTAKPPTANLAAPVAGSQFPPR